MSDVVIRAGDRILRPRGGISISNADPGGFTSLQAPALDVRGLRPDARVIAMLGGEYLFFGRVNESGGLSRDGEDSAQLSAVGEGVVLKDNPYREVYVDRDLNHWTDQPLARSIQNIGNSFAVPPASVKTDDANPSIDTGWDENSGWSATAKPDSEAWYWGGGCTLSHLQFDWTKGGNVDAANVNWAWSAYLLDDEVASSFDSSGNERGAAGPQTLTTAAATRKFSMLQHTFGAAGGAAAGSRRFSIYWKNIAIFGTHGLTRRTPLGAFSIPQGLYPVDIAVDAVSRSGLSYKGGKVDSSLYVCPHAVYFQATEPEQIVSDMAKLMGWHYGVWEPVSLADEVASFYFSAPPQDATIAVSRSKLRDLDIPKVRRDLLYNKVLVNYQDSGGRAQSTTVTSANSLMGDMGDRVMSIDAGIQTSVTAAAYGLNVLLLSQVAARGSGSATLPQEVSTTKGRMASALVRAGRDRIRILNFPDPGTLTEYDPQRYDTFRITQVDISIDEFGQLQTKVSFDAGADLLETLTARIELERIVYGA